MGMKEAFDYFFGKYRIPKIPYMEGLVSKELILLDTLSKNGYASWVPRLQEEKISFEKIEEELGFKIHPQIKEFLNTYWFRTLEAKMEVCGKKYLLH